MRSSLIFSTALPALALAAPPSQPHISQLVFSGSGCPNDSGSVKADSANLGDTFGVSFSALKGTTTDNCAVHIQSSGASAGWQVALKEITYEGDVNLKGNSGLDTYTQVFWSENAGNTVRERTHQCPPLSNTSMLIPHTGYIDRRSRLRRPRDQRLRYCAV
jgi:hypothetical protein